MDIKYYDERYYLTMIGVFERRMLELWKERVNRDKDEEMNNYSSLIEEYNLYIKTA